MDKNKVKEFKKELKALLKKYNATIGFSVGDGSDTHGLYDERIEVDLSDKPEILAHGWGVDQYDL